MAWITRRVLVAGVPVMKPMLLEPTGRAGAPGASSSGAGCAGPGKCECKSKGAPQGARPISGGAPARFGFEPGPADEPRWIWNPQRRFPQSPPIPRTGTVGTAPGGSVGPGASGEPVPGAGSGSGITRGCRSVGPRCFFVVRDPKTGELRPAWTDCPPYHGCGNLPGSGDSYCYPSLEAYREACRRVCPMGSGCRDLVCDAPEIEITGHGFWKPPALVCGP